MKKIVLTLTAVMLFAWQGLSFADSSVDSLIQNQIPIYAAYAPVIVSLNGWFKDEIRSCSTERHHSFILVASSKTLITRPKPGFKRCSI